MCDRITHSLIASWLYCSLSLVAWPFPGFLWGGLSANKVDPLTVYVNFVMCYMLCTSPDRKVKTVRMQFRKNVTNIVKVHCLVIVHIWQGMTWELLHSHCCSHVVMESPQGTGTPLTLTGSNRESACYLEQNTDDWEHVSVTGLNGFCRWWWPCVCWLLFEPPPPPS